MIKEYRKVATIKAEQFDGSDEMMEKYYIDVFPKITNRRYFMHTLEGILELHANDWIATGSNGEHWAIRDDIFRKTYQEVK